MIVSIVIGFALGVILYHLLAYFHWVVQRRLAAERRRIDEALTATVPREVDFVPKWLRSQVVITETDYATE